MGQGTDRAARSAATTAAAVRAGDEAPGAAVAAALQRIEAVNPAVNAITEAFPDAVAAAEGMAVSSTDERTLLGVPVSIKTNIDVAGSATHAGVVALADDLPEGDAPLVERLRAAGAVVVGRGNMCDLGLRWHTDNALFGPTINPWDRGLSPGGSSGGDAVAVATGMVPLAFGNDYGGSLRIPAAANGVASLRPGLGRIPDVASTEPRDKTPTLAMFATCGPIARNVADLRLAFEAVLGAHPGDPASLPRLAEPVRPPRRVQVVLDDDTTPEVEALLRRAADGLAEAGYEVVEGTPPMVDEGALAWLAMAVAEIRAILLPLVGELLAENSRRFLERAIEAADAELDPPDLLTAMAIREAVVRAWSEHHAEHGFVLAPVFTLGVPEPDRDLAAPLEVWRSLRHTVGANLRSTPALSFPVRVGDAAPSAVQVLGPACSEEALLDLGEELEAVLPTGWVTDPT